MSKMLEDYEGKMVLDKCGYVRALDKCGYVWDSLTERFGRVIAADFLGYGLSDKPVQYDYSIVDQADMVEALLEKLGVNAVHILGHDMGDTVGQELIARYNEGKAKFDIHSVCLMNGGMFDDHSWSCAFVKLIELVLFEKKCPTTTRFSSELPLGFHMKDPSQSLLALVAMRLMGKISFSKGLGETFGPQTQPSAEEFEDYWALLRYNDGNLVQHGIIQYLPQRFANRERWVPALYNTKLPLHLVFGPSDPVNPAATFLVKYKELVKNSGVTELSSNVGHYLHLEDPQAVVGAYFNFLDSLKNK
ncbi:putative mesoderm-specific transcript protein [Apostichopus japonicus]|uniref:Putative mesoderm-specific transcript protein n=1 Tax=Stichopus japonicus TaxID=307972 RepID=A0A2G8L4R1_STIJA|nr:putative mesoderm-specific transcript protein [Apostichopus japonicus]